MRPRFAVGVPSYEWPSAFFAPTFRLDRAHPERAPPLLAA